MATRAGGYQPGAGSGKTTGSGATPGSSGNRTASSNNAGDATVVTEHGTHDVSGPQNRYSPDKTSTIDSLLKDGYHESAAWVKSLQDKLVKAGLLESGAYTSGLYDEGTLAAYQTLLLRASNYGKTPDETFKLIFESNPTPKGSGGAAGPTFSFQPPDPEQIKQAVKEATPSILGRALSDKESAMLAGEITARLTAAARANFNTDQTGGVASPAFDPQSYIANRAKELHPDEANQYGLIQQGKVFYSMIGAAQEGNG